MRRPPLGWLVMTLLVLVIAAPPATAQLPIGEDPPPDDPPATEDTSVEPGGPPATTTEIPEFDGEIRLDSDLGGYVVEASGSPLEILVFEPVFPVPVDPGQPHLSVETAHTRSLLSTGPVARGLASSAWPGALLGDGFGTLAGQVTGDDAQTYPLSADARYPGTTEAAAEIPETGLGMRAVAQGLNVRAEAQTGQVPEAAGNAGSYESDSIATVVGAEAIATTRVVVSDLAVIPGVLEFGNVTTDLVASAVPDGGATSGVTTVSGLTIAGQGYTLDGQGLRPVAGGEPADPVAPAPPLDAAALRDALGIEIQLLEQTEQISDIAVERQAGGVRVVIDTRVLRAYLEEPLLQPLITSLPPEAVSLPIFPFLFLGSEVELVIASGEVSSSAVAPFTFSSPPPGGAVGVAPVGTSAGSTGTVGGGSGGTSSGTGTSPSTGATGAGSPISSGTTTPALAPPPGGGPAPGVADVPGIAAAPMPTLPVSTDLPAAGIGAGLVLAGLMGTALASRGLRALTGPALGIAGGGSSTCTEGRPTGAPTLRADR